MRRLVRFVDRHRRRLATLAAVLGLGVLALTLWPAVPRETQLELVLGPEHAQVVEVRVAYVQQQEELHGVRLGFPQGAPAVVRHRVSLPSGRFEVRLHLLRRAGPALSFVRTLHTPADGVVRLRLAAGDEGEA